MVFYEHANTVTFSLFILVTILDSHFCGILFLLAMNENEFNPGAAKYGNFINYYQFNPPENRISLMPPNLLQLAKIDNETTILCLDVGCNTGELTSAIYNHLVKCLKEYANGINSVKEQRVIVIGIDVDSILIERANESNDNPNILYVCLDIMKDDSESVLNSYLKRYNKQHFDISFSFSITMWIHLNHGDDGLKCYLSNLCECSNNVLIEPQPWKCYKSAVRRMKRCNGEQFSEFKKLSIRDSVELEISKMMTDFYNFVKLFETHETKWGRKISLYTKEYNKS